MRKKKLKKLAAAEPETIPAKAQKRPTIAELEAILNKEGEETIEILPNGEVRAATRVPDRTHAVKPLTMREDLGGEYAVA